MYRKVYIFEKAYQFEEVILMVPHKKREEYGLERDIEKEVEAILKGEEDIEFPSPEE